MATYKSIAYDQPLTAGGSMVLLQEKTASTSDDISFTSGIDSTYKEYVFRFINLHPSANDSAISWQVNASGESGYNETITSTSFRAALYEADSNAALDYLTGSDQAQGTDVQILSDSIGSDNDQCISGELTLYNPSSTTFVKHWAARISVITHSDAMNDRHTAGYINTTAAITEIQFTPSSGTIDDGTIKMYGIN